MSRLLLTTLSCVTMVGLSCAIHPRTPAALPPVAAPPPGLERAAAPGPEPTAAADPSDVELVATIAASIAERRGTGITEFEVVDLARTIVAEARRHDIEPSLVLAVIQVESRYNAFALSPVGAIGLMQILPSTGEELAAKEGIFWRGPQTLFDPLVNVRLGVAYLRELSDRYGSLSTALAAYNWGPGHIDRRLRRGAPMPQTYPTLVFEAYTARPERSS